MNPCEYCDSRCGHGDPCSKERPLYWPISFRVGPVRVSGHVNDRYLSLRADWRGRFRFEDEK
jgi:hypothetical protein